MPIWKIKCVALEGAFLVEGGEGAMFHLKFHFIHVVGTPLKDCLL